MAWQSFVSESRRRILPIPTAVVFSLAILASPSLLQAHVERLSVRDLAAVSPQVVVASVEERRSRWNDLHTLVVTDYTLRVEESLRGTSSERITLTVPGGTVGTVSDDTCVSVHLQPGGRYLLFLGDLGRPTLTPVLGAGQGMFREVPGARSGVQAPLAASGSSSLPLMLKGKPVLFRDLVGAVRSLLAEIPFAPRPELPISASLPAKAWNPGLSSSPIVRSIPPQAAPEAFTPPLLAAGAPGIVEIAGDVSTAPRRSSPLRAEKFLFNELAPRPVVVNPLTDSPFAPWDQYAMAYWNRYSAGLFQVADPPNPAWDYGNGVSEIVGFPDDTVMQRQFGYRWDDLGGGVLGVAFTRRVDGVLVEADVALSPKKAWTLDDLAATSGREPVFAFKEVILHELGHVWGLKHPWDDEAWVTWDAVMNYKFRQYYVAELYGDDTAAVRRAFPPGTPLRDGLISSYVTVRNEVVVNPDYRTPLPVPASVKAGGTFGLNGPIKVENVGSVVLADPLVEVYLAPARLTFDGALLVQRAKVRGKVQPGGTLQVKLKSLKVPRGAPAGTYYLAYFLRDAKDAYQGNNAAWSLDGYTLTVTR